MSHNQFPATFRPPLDSESWTCQGCAGPFIGARPVDDTCGGCRARQVTTEAQASPAPAYSLVVMVGGEAFEAVFEHGSDVAVLQVRGLEQAERLAKSASKIKAVTKRVECTTAAVARARANEAAVREAVNEAKAELEPEVERRASRLADVVAEAEWVGREWPDGVHTCEELQRLEPGRRPCTCGRCEPAGAEAPATLAATGLARPASELMPGVLDEIESISPPPDPERAALIEGLLQLADCLQAHPEADLPYDGTGSELLFQPDGAAEFLSTARALGCKWTPREWTPQGSDDADAFFEVTGKLAGLKIKLLARRDELDTGLAALRAEFAPDPVAAIIRSTP